MSCKCCAHIGGNGEPHTPLTCSYRRSLYCYVCAVYGHAPRCCPNQKALACRNGEDPDEVENREFVVLDSEQAIRYMLKMNGVTPVASIDENKSLLHDYANSLSPPKMVVYKRH